MTECVFDSICFQRRFNQSPLFHNIKARQYRYYHYGRQLATTRAAIGSHKGGNWQPQGRQLAAVRAARGSHKGGTCRPTRKACHKTKKPYKSAEIKFGIHPQKNVSGEGLERKYVVLRRLKPLTEDEISERI